MEISISFMVGFVCYALIISNIPKGKIYYYNMAIESCEKELPRNQQCVITATVKNRSE